jgi:predicted GNAT superfamily acetyltransferase
MYYNGRYAMNTSTEQLTGIAYRHCESESDFASVIAIQRETWGEEDVVPPNLLKAVRKIGGIVAGAFDDSGRMLGCVFGMSGIREGRLVHWSHMLAVRAEARGRGLGHGLKTFQRDDLITAGIDRMYWTYDPLEAVNAHFNIHRLGARPAEYVEDMYGTGENNPLHEGLGTDRFIVEWDFSKPSAPIGDTSDTPVVNQFLDRKDGEIPANAPVVRVEVPRNVQQLKTDRPDEARIWRAASRQAFQRCLHEGYAVTGFELGDRSYYILERNT